MPRGTVMNQSTPRAPFPGGWQSEGLTGGFVRSAILPIERQRVVIDTTPAHFVGTPLKRGDGGVS